MIDGWVDTTNNYGLYEITATIVQLVILFFAILYIERELRKHRLKKHTNNASYAHAQTHTNNASYAHAQPLRYIRD